MLKAGKTYLFKSKNSKLQYLVKITKQVDDGIYGKYCVYKFSDGHKNNNPILHKYGFFPTGTYSVTKTSKKLPE